MHLRMSGRCTRSGGRAVSQSTACTEHRFLLSLLSDATMVIAEAAFGLRGQPGSQDAFTAIDVLEVLGQALCHDPGRMRAPLWTDPLH